MIVHMLSFAVRVSFHGGGGGTIDIRKIVTVGVQVVNRWLRNTNVPGGGREEERQGVIECDVPNVADVCFAASFGLSIIHVGLHLAIRGELHFADDRGVAIAALHIEYADVGIEDPVVLAGDGNVGAGHGYAVSVAGMVM